MAQYTIKQCNISFIVFLEIFVSLKMYTTYVTYGYGYQLALGQDLEL